MNTGKYVVFEGIAGTGKTTQSKLLVEYLRENYPEHEVIWTREPGGDIVADAVRKVAQGNKFDDEMEVLCEAYLYAASRAQTLRSVMAPVLGQDGIVVADRSFISSLAYQGSGRGLGLDTVWKINRVAVENFIPDLVIYLSLDLEVALSRTFDAAGDKFETFDREFFEKVRKGYREASQLEVLQDRWITVDASGTESEVFERVLEPVDGILQREIDEIGGGLNDAK